MSTNGHNLTAAQMLAQTGEAGSASVPAIVEDPFPVHDDPFPVLATADPTPKPKAAPKALNVSDESAFPSLGGGAPKKTGSLWGAGGSAAQRIKQLAPAQPNPGSISGTSTPRSGTSNAGDADGVSRAGVFTATVQLAAQDIHIQAPASGPRRAGTFSNEGTGPSTLGEVMKLLMKLNAGTTIDASTSRSITTFIIKSKGPSAEADVAKVRRELLARTSKRVTIDVDIPASLRAFIIGAKGKTLKDITDATGAQIQIPPRDPNEDLTPTDALPDGPLIAIQITGESSAAQAAKAKVLQIVSERAAKVQTPLPQIPQIFWPHINGVKGARLAQILAAAGAEAATVTIPRAHELRGVSVLSNDEEPASKAKEKVVTVAGEREAVQKAVDALEAEVAELRSSLKELAYGVSKAQHRFLVGPNADAILASTGCSIELPPADSADDKITIRGPQAALVPALQLVIEQGSSIPIETLDLSTAHRGDHDRLAYAAQLTRYILKAGKFKQLAKDNSAEVFLPRDASIKAGQAFIEVTAKTKESVAGARTAIIAVVRQLPPQNFALVDVDSLHHRHLTSPKQAKKLKAVQSEHSVELLFPPEREERSDLLLVYTGAAEPSTSLAAVKAAVEELAKEAAEIKSNTISIPASLHKNIQGPNGTNLNAVIGEDKLASVQFGAGGDDQVLIRGPADEVARVTKELQRLEIEAKDNEVASSHVEEFEIDAVHVRHIVGKAGSGINKLRDDLGVRVDFEEKKGGGKSKVVVKGRKENALEAKKRILSQADRFADEVTLAIPLPATLERGSLIGKQGTYLKRLEEKYDVKINFPKNKADEPAAKSEITVRGGKKGAELAKGELVDLIEYEKTNGNVLTFTVTVKSLPRILGKAGATINQIKDDTNASVDVDQASDDATTATITVKGTKTGIAAAKTAILAIAKEVDDEARLTLEIPKELHTTLIGSGGSSIRDLIGRCGGPTDTRASGQMVRFPRQGDATDTVTITAPKAIAHKIKAELEKEVATLNSRVVWGVAVPASQHASVIGKGASALQELQRKHGVKVVMPGWNDYTQTGDVANAEDVADASAGDIVKIVGPKEAAVAAAADLSKGRPSAPTVRETVMIPNKFHAKIAQGGRFFRSLPSGTRVTHDGQKPPSSAGKSRKPPAATNGGSAPAARIDDDESAAAAGPAEVEFTLVSLYDGEDAQDESEIPWVVESTTKENADQVVSEIKKQLALAHSATHVGWITVPTGVMPRIVGRGGSGLDKLRAEGVEVEVVGRRGSNQLTIEGTPEAIERAHKSIVQLAAPRERRQYRDYEDDY